MKGLKLILVFVLTILFTSCLINLSEALTFSSNLGTFHSGGVGACEGCHSMHNSFEGSAELKNMPQFQSGPYLLKAQDQSGACLNCHEGLDTVPTTYHISTAGVNQYDSTSPVEMTPGGDFAWLKKTMTGSVGGVATTWDGDRHGHNIIAVDFGYTAPDKTLTTAPGGTYPAANLGCHSCHDPHGTFRRDATGAIGTPTNGFGSIRVNLPIFGSGSYTDSANPIAGSAVGVYRLLAGVGYQPKSLTGSYAFVNPTPDAVAKRTYNGVSTDVRTPANQVDLVAYGQNMSEWCANCHAAMHTTTFTSGTKGLVHPASNNGKLTAPIAANYNAYVSSGIMTATGTNFSALAPYEIGSNDYTGTLKPFASGTAASYLASTSNNVACVACHRSHATAFESMTRYFLGAEFMTVADSAGAAIYDTSTTENRINTGYTTIQQTNAYNGRPATVFGPFARNYCNKCHAKD